MLEQKMVCCSWSKPSAEREEEEKSVEGKEKKKKKKKEKKKKEKKKKRKKKTKSKRQGPGRTKFSLSELFPVDLKDARLSDERLHEQAIELVPEGGAQWEQALDAGQLYAGL
jgi:DNA modification methylase